MMKLTATAKGRKVFAEFGGQKAAVANAIGRGATSAEVKAKLPNVPAGNISWYLCVWKRDGLLQEAKTAAPAKKSNMNHAIAPLRGKKKSTRRAA
jgi:hypothetical protein